MATKNVTELDFDGIRNNLKLFLQSQSEFEDYDFEASGLTVLLDLLAYNTHYNAVLAHMVANEAFIDSATKRSSVASIAKTMGYTARSARSSEAKISLTIVPDPTYTLGSYTLSRNAIFTTTIQGTQYTFYPKQDYTVNLTNDTESGDQVFIFNNIEICEGTRVETSQIVEAGTESGPLVMSNQNVDTTTIRCRIQESLTNTNLTTYTFSDNILNLKSDSNVFFVEEAIEGNYQVTFGDGVLGTKLTIGNVIRLDYIATNGPAANGAKVFSHPTNLTGANETITMTIVENSSGGQLQESIDSIRFNAPRFNATKNRAVTSNDYQSLILSANPNVKSVAVWGGEDNDPPMYGQVFVSLQADEGKVITQDDKDTILRDFIEPRQPISIRTAFVDPEFTFIGMNVSIDYDAKATTLTAGQIISSVNTTISNYFDSELNILDANFYYSKLVSLVVETSPSIVAANLELRTQKRFTPTMSKILRYQLYFNNKTQPRSVTSNYFDAVINTATYKVYLSDVPNEGVIAPDYTGTGVLQLKTADKNIIVDANAGTINYDTGEVDITSLQVTKIYGSATQISVTTTPHESSKDIKTEVLRRTTESSGSAVIPTPSKNIILAQDTTSADIPNNIYAGTIVVANPKVKDY